MLQTTVLPCANLHRLYDAIRAKYPITQMFQNTRNSHSNQTTSTVDHFRVNTRDHMVSWRHRLITVYLTKGRLLILQPKYIHVYIYQIRLPTFQLSSSIHKFSLYLHPDLLATLMCTVEKRTELPKHNNAESFSLKKVNKVIDNIHRTRARRKQKFYSHSYIFLANNARLQNSGNLKQGSSRQ